MRRRGVRRGAVLVPRAPVGLHGHVRQGIEAVIRTECDFVYRHIGFVLPLAVKTACAIHIAVRRTVQLGGVVFQRVGAELLHVHRHRGGEALRPQRVEAQTSAACVFQEVQPVLFARLVARHQRRRARDGGVRSRNVGNARLAAHAFFSCFSCFLSCLGCFSFLSRRRTLSPSRFLFSTFAARSCASLRRFSRSSGSRCWISW